MNRPEIEDRASVVAERAAQAIGVESPAVVVSGLFMLLAALVDRLPDMAPMVAALGRAFTFELEKDISQRLAQAEQPATTTPTTMH